MPKNASKQSPSFEEGPRDSAAGEVNHRPYRLRPSNSQLCIAGYDYQVGINLTSPGRAEKRAAAPLLEGGGIAYLHSLAFIH